MSKHTPGLFRNCHTHIENSYGEIIYRDVRHFDEVNPADARLFAAAPEMLEACKAMIEWFDAEENFGDTTFNERIAMCKRAEDLSREAIVKAEEAT